MKQPENIQSWSQAADQHSVTPPPMVWERIEARLDQKEKKRPVAFWWLGAALLFIAGLIWLNASRDRYTTTTKPVNHRDSYQPAGVSDGHTAGDIHAAKEPGDKPSGAEPGTVAAASPASGPGAYGPANDIRQPILASSEDNITDRRTDDGNDHNKTIPEIQKSGNGKSSDRITGSTAGIPGGGPDEDRRQQSVPEAAGNALKHQPAERNTIELFDPLTPLTFRPAQQHKYDFSPIHSGKNVTCYSFREGKNRFFLGLEGGPGLPLRKLNNRLEEGKLYANKLETEQPWYAYSASIHAGMLLKNNIFFYSGFNLAGIKEKFDYRRTGLTQIVITFDPVTNQPIDTSVQTGTVINSGENHIRLYQIPVSIGYQKAFNKWSVGVDAGMYFNLSASARGKLLWSDGNVRKLEDATLYKNRIGMSAQIALTFGCMLDDSWSLYLRPQYVKALQSWTTENSSIEQSYDMIHVNLGVRKFFGKK